MPLIKAQNRFDATDDDIIETLSNIHSEAPDAILLRGELKRRENALTREALQIQKDLLFSQQQAASAAETSSMYAADNLLYAREATTAAKEAAEAAKMSAAANESTANHTKQYTKYMGIYLLIILISSIATFIIQLVQLFQKH